ncbi:MULTISPECIES: hypothetical protein [unclassified Exiguobacterium]|uniref:hypothetical protein n=1 Tax=unclassified Exiguobacterium TaxID=2644629 RepID=UPI001BEAD829|nr:MULTISPECIES: hypothetical protein [unclassified Exiguobacterium]
MDTTRLRHDPNFKIGLVVGMALAHAQKHVDENQEGMTTAQRGLEIERMTNLILFELLEKPIKL